MMRIAFTGGGTAGHVNPNLALIEAAGDRDCRCYYIGSTNGIEADLVSARGIPFFGIASGKLRRYFAWQNFIDPIKIVWGFFQALLILLRQRPAVLFSKGGFVAVPVVLAAALLRIKIVIHESDVSPGLANRLSAPFCHWVCLNFEETQKQFRHRYTRVTGTPLRAGLKAADADRGRAWLASHKGMQSTQPLLLVVGGSLGSRALNACIRTDLPELTARFQVVHVVGKHAIDQNLLDYPGYIQFEYLDEPFGDVLAAADLVVSRAGANAIYELLCFHKPQLLIPLPATASRGDQIENAALFTDKGYALVVREEALGPGELAESVETLWADKAFYVERLRAFHPPDSVSQIWQVIDDAAAKIAAK